MPSYSFAGSRRGFDVPTTPSRTAKFLEAAAAFLTGGRRDVASAGRRLRFAGMPFTPVADLPEWALARLLPLISTQIRSRSCSSGWAARFLSAHLPHAGEIARRCRPAR